MGKPSTRSRIERTDEQQRAVFQAAAPLIDRVGLARGEEFAEQVAMGGDALDAGKTGVAGHPGCRGEARNHLGDVALGRGASLRTHRPAVSPAPPKAYRFGVEVADGLAAGVLRLHPGRLRVTARARAAKRLLAAIAVDDDIFGALR